MAQVLLDQVGAGLVFPLQKWLYAKSCPASDRLGYFGCVGRRVQVEHLGIESVQ